MSALSASRTRPDFSFTPVSACAFATKSSSSASVVRIRLSVGRHDLASNDDEFHALMRPGLGMDMRAVSREPDFH